MIQGGWWMKFRIGIENNNEGIRSIAWVLEHLGCFAYGDDGEQALANVVGAIRAYVGWMKRHGEAWVVLVGEIEPVPEQVWTDYQINEAYDHVSSGGYDVDSFFQHDWKPLTGVEIERARKLLSWSRADLLGVVGHLVPQQWGSQITGERWDIAGITNHIGSAEWWYLDRLGLAFPRAELSPEPLARLDKVRAWLNDQLAQFEGSAQVVGIEGEFWSPRKVLRRALWHERDHTEHIQKVLAQHPG